ncbi:MAG: Na+/H+ antiporter NhaA [Deltaproteobacteria bacterium]|nr:Na+/H+ antiporter NhaA [Deltaproteobacteria bacterium]
MTNKREVRPQAPAGPRLFTIALRPLQAFFRLEAASGLILLGCAVAALAWANLHFDSYDRTFGAPLTIGAGPILLRFTLHQLVNDGLMALFFFVVGMEIKRELVEGELRTPSQAMLPAIAALGGMVVPAAIYLAFNTGGPGAPGWGIPMATDIAFCVGVLTLLRSRVPHALIVFVTALAIFDDIGGILVIAVFYGSGVQATWLLATLAVGGAALAMSRAQVRSAPAWAIVGALLWYTLHHSGIHATISGVILGLAIPATARRRPREVLHDLSVHASALARAAADHEQDEAALRGIEGRLEELEAPLTRFVRALHPWMAFGVMPLFALANSGVHLAALDASQITGRVTIGTLLALFAGKLAGIFGFTLAAVRLGVARAPGGASSAKLLGVSAVAGIGFTVALFIAGLAFPSTPRLLDEAKLGILVGSLVSGVVGALILRATAPVPAAPARRGEP